MSVLRQSFQLSISKSKYRCFFKPAFSSICSIRLHRLYCASATLTTPAPDGFDKIYPPKIKQIVDEIAKLTLIEVADLNDCLKKTLNIKDVPMSMGVMPAAAAAVSTDEDAELQVAKSSFTVKLLKFEDKKKVSVIKEIKKYIDGMNLVQAKRFVESVPQIVKADIGKDEAETLKKELEAAGATCEIV